MAIVTDKKGEKARSNCCGGFVEIGGEGMTHYYICDECGNACDIVNTAKYKGTKHEDTSRKVEHSDGLEDLILPTEDED